jgi:hypothetical protein
MSDNNQKAAFGILAGIAAAITTMKMREKGSMSKPLPTKPAVLSRNEEALASSMRMVQELKMSERNDPFLGQEVGMVRGRRPQNPEYVLIFDLVDAALVPLPDYMETPPDRPYGRRDVGNMRRELRPDPRGILMTNKIGELTSKSQFFAAVELVRPMIEEDAELLNLSQMQDGNFAMRPELAMHAGFDLARPQDVGNFKQYRINMIALASSNGQPIMAPVLPFSNLFHTFEMYKTRQMAEYGYETALQRLQEWASRNGISILSRRRLR